MSTNVGSGSLHWVTGIDNSQLKKDADEAVNIVDKASDKMTKKQMFAAAIKQQKELITSVEEDVKRLQRTYDSMTSGRAKNGVGGIGSDLGAAKRALAEEQANLTKIQQEGISSNVAVEASQGGVISSLVAYASGLFTVVAAWKAFKFIMESTSSTALAFHSTVEGLKAGLDYLGKSIANWDWSNFIQGMKDVIKAGKDYAKQKEYIANVEREYGLKTLDLNHKIEEQRRIFYESDPEKENLDSKVAAGDQMLAYMKEKSDLEIEIALKNYKAIAELSSKKNKMSEDEIKYAIENFKAMEETGSHYNRLKNLVDQYNKAKKSGLGFVESSNSAYVSQGKGLPEQLMSEQLYLEYKQKMNDLGPDAATQGVILKKYETLTEKEKQIIYNAVADQKKAENSYLEESKRVVRLTENMKTRAYNLDADKLQAQSEYEAELNQKRLENEFKIRQMMITAEKDGAEKQRQQAQLDYEKTLSDIDKQNAEIVKKKNELSGGLKHGQRTYKYDSTLPKDVINQTAELQTQAEEVKNAKILQINEKAKDDLAKIFRDISGAFLGEIDKEKAAINAKYDEYTKRAVAAGATVEQLKEIENGRVKELLQAEQDATVKVSDYWKKIFGDITESGYAAIKKLISDTKSVLDSATQKEVKGQTFYMVEIPVIDAEGKAVKQNVKLTVEEFNQLEKKFGDLNKIAREKNPFKGVADSFTEMMKAIKSGKKDDLGNALEGFDKSSSKIIADFEEMGKALGDAFGADVETDIKVVTDLLGGAKDVAVGIGKIAAGDPEGIVQLVKGVAKIFKTLTDGNKKYEKDSADFLNKMIEMTLKYKNVLIDLIQAQKGAYDSVFLNNYANQILQASIAIRKSEDALRKINLGDQSHDRVSNMSSSWNDMLIDNQTANLPKFLDKLQVQIGTTKKKFLGITTGSSPVYGSLLDKFPELIDENGKFNSAIAETIVNMEGLPAVTKNALQGLIDYNNQIKESKEAMESAISSMAGFIASDLSSALVNAWDNGTDAFEAFRVAVTGGLKKIVEEMIFNAVFAQAFQQLQDNMKQTFGEGGDKNITDDMKKFFDQYPELVKNWQDAMTSAAAQSAAAGMDWNTLKTSGGAAQPSLAGAIEQSITERTADVLAGQMNAMQINVIEQLRVFKQSVEYQRLISENTSRTNDILQQIYMKADTADGLRASGLMN